jgi:hypothetical protein
MACMSNFGFLQAEWPGAAPFGSKGAGFDSAFFDFVLLPSAPLYPAPLPFTPYFSPFTAYYLTYPYWHAILSRVY